MSASSLTTLTGLPFMMPVAGVPGITAKKHVLFSAAVSLDYSIADLNFGSHALSSIVNILKTTLQFRGHHQRRKDL
jgi:hypothetical protein